MTSGIPDDIPQVDPGKGSIELGKDSKDKSNAFDIFWKEYPKKIGKQLALISFNKINPNKTLLKVILKDIETKKKSEQWLKDNGKFIQYPASYLNQQRWEDEDKGNEPVKKPYYKGDPLYGEPYSRTIKVKGEIKQFAGREDEIEWK